MKLFLKKLGNCWVVVAFVLAIILLPLLALAGESAKELAQEEAHHELPNFMSMIYSLNQARIDAWLDAINAKLPPLLKLEWINIENLTFAFLVVFILSLIAIIGSRGRALRPKSKLYTFLEWSCDSLYQFFSQILGKDTRRYIALVGTLFIYILSLNLFGLIPLMKSPTSVWGINLAMAICVFLYVQWTGIVRNGPVGYLKHLIGRPWWLFPLMLPLHILEELIKPVSLSLRLFGNIFGEDTLIAVLGGIMILFGVFAVPFQTPFMFLAVLFSTIQALIFSMLSAVYILLMLPSEEGH